MAEATLRRGAPADLEALHALVERCYRGDDARRGWTHEADLLGGQRTDRESLTATLADVATAVMVAERDGAMVGCVQIAVRDGPAYLGLLSVDPAHQAGGLGARLIAAAEAHARRAGARAVEMTVIAQRGELVAYYQRRGYALSSETRPFPLDDERFGLPTRRDLYFVVLTKSL